MTWKGFARLRALAAAALAIAMIAVPASADAADYGERKLRVGMSGKDVKQLQTYLTRAGFRTAADGQFGRRTARRVRAWEGATDRKVNGVVGRGNARAIRADALDSTSEDTQTEEAPPENTGEEATVGDDGLAVAPASAPPEVKAVIAAGNEIAKKPYKYGGGHGSWEDSGYDCSGSMSYALHGAGLVRRPLDSTGFMSWRRAGKGEWITTYAHGGHSYMVVAGLRFDTSGRKERGTRWTDEMRSSRGYTVRHPNGL